MAIEWPAGATCGRCKWWSKESKMTGECGRLETWTYGPATKALPMVTPEEYGTLYTHRDHGCRAWEPKE